MRSICTLRAVGRRVLPPVSDVGVLLQRSRAASSSTPLLASKGNKSSSADADGLTDLERAVSEQQKVLFPRMQELEEARNREDLALRGASVPKQEWSPKRVPYKVFEKEGAAADSDEEDSDREDDDAAGGEEMGLGGGSASQELSQQPAASRSVAVASGSASAGVEEIDGVQVGIDDMDLEGSSHAGLHPSVSEEGFTYRGPEPTLFGDWQHKGRATDF